jgi:hypothetical protein
LNLSGQLEQLGQLGLHIPKLPGDPPLGVHDDLGLNRRLGLQRILEGLNGGEQISRLGFLENRLRGHLVLETP